MRKAFIKAGYGHIPIISLNVAGLEKNSGFKLTLDMIPKALGAVSYGDLLMLLDEQVRTYEINKGDSRALLDKWVNELCDDFEKNRSLTNGAMKKKMKEIVLSFANIPIKRFDAVKVGVVGEIFVKYSPLANNDLEEFSGLDSRFAWW